MERNYPSLDPSCYIGLNQLAKGEELLNRALEIFHQLQEPADIAQCHLYFGELESKRGNHTEAIVQWQLAVDLLQKKRAHMIKQQALSHLMLHYLRAGKIAKSLDAFACLLNSLLSQGIQPYSAISFIPPNTSTATSSAHNDHDSQTGA